MIYRDTFKRPFDIALSGISLLALAPVMVLVAVAVRFEDGGPSLFHQDRVGKEGRAFRIFKFRSMPVNVGNLPSAAAAALKVTRVGRIIRRANLDELPQLFNILAGDMSVVGPRPALPSQHSLTALRQGNGAMACRPGLTGLAQVNSYDGMPEEEKAEHDGHYASRITFWGDLRIILRTFTYLAHRPPTY